MFFIVNIHCVNNETFEEEVIRVTTERHYSLANNGAYYLPHLKSVMNFEEQLFSKGATTGEATVGVGEIIISNTDGEFDRYRKFSFDGRKVEVFLLKDQHDQPSDSNVFFRGTAFYAEPQLSQLSIYIKNRLEILTPLIQPSTFLGTNNGGPDGYEGNEGDLKGKTKPMVWGTCLNVPLAPINKSKLIYGCNFDHLGNRKAVAKFFNVADKGGALLWAGDVPDIANLHATTVASGFYKTCVAEGAVKLGRVAQGEVTADVAETLGPDSSAPRIVRRILESVYGLVAGVDFDLGDLENLHQLNATACGYFVDEEVEGLTVINDLMGSIGGWFVPDRLGIFRSGRFDLPQYAEVPVATFDDALILTGSLAKLPTGDQGHGIPAKTYTLFHSKLWKVLQKNETLVSVPDNLREYYAQEFRSTTFGDSSIGDLHPLAPDLSDESLMVVLPPVKIGSFLEDDLGDPPSNWDMTGDSEVIADNMLLLNQSLPPALHYNFGSDGVSHLLENQIEELWNGRFTLQFYVDGQSDVDSTQLDLYYSFDGFLFPFFPDSYYPGPGWHALDFEHVNDGPGMSWLLAVTQTTGWVEIGKFSITPKPEGLTPDEEALRRFQIYSKNLERWLFDVPILEGLYVNLGEVVIMKTYGRMELTDGRKFRVIGKNVVADEHKVAFDVIGVDEDA